MFASRQLLVFTSVICASLLAAADDASEHEYYRTHVAPLLKQRCGACHSHGTRTAKGGLVVDSRTALLTGGETGPAIDLQRPDQSLILQAIRRQGGLEMPPQGEGEPLTAAEIAIVEKWIRAGAHAPEVAATSPVASGPSKRKQGPITDEDRRWWAFSPVSEGAATGEIDDRLATKLDATSKAGERAKLSLLRRVTFDLTGYPPRWEEALAFLADETPEAYARVVDRLLASPRFGEHLARDWLDLVRYADSDGYRIDDFRPHAWRYRDYVIQSFNSDKPYDRFVQEQLAGDELFSEDPQANIATGYYRQGIYEYNNRDVRGQWSTILNDITDTTADVFLGLGLQCARCHDHKYDPLLQRDYFALQACFAPMKPYEEQPVATPAEVAQIQTATVRWEELTADLQKQLAALEQPYRERAEKDAVSKFPEDIQVILNKPAAERSALEQQLQALAFRQVRYEWARLDGKLKGDDKERWVALRKQLAAFDHEKPPAIPVAPTIANVGPDAPPVLIPKKGDAEVLPAVPTVLQGIPWGAADEKSLSPAPAGRRAALAQWLTRPENPLTPRLVTNRIWQHYFGTGLAPNPSDFGHLSAPPTRLDLLDHLAARLVQDGFRLKPLHRRIVLSAAYRQLGDLPSTELVGRRLRRLQAEEIRDALFFVSGEMIFPAGGVGAAGNEPRPSIYRRILRNTRDELLDAFDAPLWFTSAPTRDVTTTPLQSLTLINGPFVRQRASALAARIEKSLPRSPGEHRGEQIRQAYRFVMSREPTLAEITQGEQFLKSQQAQITAEPPSIETPFALEKFPNRDGQAAQFELKRQSVLRMSPAANADLPQTAPDHFTIEAFVLPRSIAEDGAIRTIAACWNGSLKESGWQFGITGKTSRRKPRTLVLLCSGYKRDGQLAEAALFSDHELRLDKPYFLSVAFQPATADSAGSAVFSLKDLSNDDEPLLTVTVAHELTRLATSHPLTIGGRNGSLAGFDGLLDDVRWSQGSLETTQLLLTAESVRNDTLGYWRFEPRPGIFADSSDRHQALLPSVTANLTTTDPAHTALSDFCHALLNSSEFLYVE